MGSIIINCHKCGKFVGDDGNKDIFYDDYQGAFEVGYPECKKCITKKEKDANRGS